MLWSQYLSDVHRPSYLSLYRGQSSLYIPFSAGAHRGFQSGGPTASRSFRPPRSHPYGRPSYFFFSCALLVNHQHLSGSTRRFNGPHHDDAPVAPYNKNGRTVTQSYSSFDPPSELFAAVGIPLPAAPEKAPNAAPVSDAVSDDPFAAISYD